MPIVNLTFANSKVVTNSSSCTGYSSQPPNLDTLYDVYSCTTENSGCDLFGIAGRLGIGDDWINWDNYQGGVVYINMAIGKSDGIPDHLFPSNKYLKIISREVGSTNRYEISSDILIEASSWPKIITSSPQDSVNLPTSTPYWVKPGCMDSVGCNSDGDQTYPCGLI